MMEMQINFPGGKKVDVNYKDFVIKTDQPPSNGGDGLYPDPFSLFLSSIGACAGFYVLSFCQSHGIETKNIKLSLNFEKDPETKMVAEINISIHLPPDFPEKYRTAVIKAADVCTVKKHLFSPPKILIDAVAQTLH